MSTMVGAVISWQGGGESRKIRCFIAGGIIAH
jgi:hypothetical protein